VNVSREDDNMTWKYEPMGSPDAYISKVNADRIISLGRSSRDKLLFLILSRTGRRLSEVLQLRPKQIMWESKSIRWRILKKRDKTFTAVLPVDEITLATLRNYIIDNQLEDNEYIFKSYGKLGHLTQRRVQALLTSYGKKLDITYLGGDKIHPHMFRHGFAIHFVKHMKRPDQIFHLQKLLQHSDIRETMWYVNHFGQSEIREMVDTMWKD
jgi:integrase